MTTQGSDYTRSDCAICIGGITQAKTAALYFRHILPLMYGECPDSVLLPDCFESELQHAIVFADMTVMPHVPDKGRIGALPINQVLVNARSGDKVVQYRPRHVELSAEEALEADLRITMAYVDEKSVFRERFSHFLDHRLKGMPLVTPLASVGGHAATMDDISVIMSGMPLIDAGSASWDQIVAFREDPAAKAKLRRFRLFAYDKLKGKSRAYVEDSVQSMMGDYEAAAKDHGFELVTGSLTTLMNSKTMFTAGGTAVVAALAGLPLGAGIAALAGVSLEIGKLAITIAQKQHAFHKLQRDHQLAYVLEVRKQLG